MTYCLTHRIVIASVEESHGTTVWVSGPPCSQTSTFRLLAVLFWTRGGHPLKVLACDGYSGMKDFITSKSESHVLDPCGDTKDIQPPFFFFLNLIGL